MLSAAHKEGYEYALKIRGGYTLAHMCGFKRVRFNVAKNESL